MWLVQYHFSSASLEFKPSFDLLMLFRWWVSDIHVVSELEASMALEFYVGVSVSYFVLSEVLRRTYHRLPLLFGRL